MGRNSGSPFRRRPWVWIVVALAALAAGGTYFFVQVGPGGGAAGPPEKVTMAYAAIADAALAITAQMKGLYRAEGLEVAVRLHPFGKPALQDVLEGRADFATVAETPFMFAILKGAKVAVIATIQTTSQTHAVVARGDRGIHAYGDLRGRKIAVALETTSDYFLDALLAVQGISRKEVTFVDMRMEEMAEALARGDVDAVSIFQPYTIFAQKKLGDRGITFQDRDIYTSTFNVVAQQEFIRRNRGKVAKLLRGLVKAEEFLKGNPAAAQKLFADFSGVDMALVREAWAGQEFGVTLDQSLLLALEDEAKWAIRNRLTGGETKIPNFLDFIDPEGLNSVKPKAIHILR